MAGNLKEGNPATEFKSGRQAVEAGRAGGIASAKAKKERKLLRDTLNDLLKMPLRDGVPDNLEKIASTAGLKGRNITMQETIMLAMLQKAAKGDVRAAEYIRDTIGQKPGMDIFGDEFESDGFIEALKEGAKAWEE